jgi:hypothetical protein
MAFSMVTALESPLPCKALVLENRMARIEEGYSKTGS